MKKDPTISVIMSVYNDKKYIERAIISIINQLYKDFEFIIVDDKSTDNSLKLIQEYAEKDERIIVIKNQKNIGLTKSLNKALEIAKGKYIARQDSDDISSFSRFKEQLYIMKNMDKRLVSTSAYILNDKNRIIGNFNKDPYPVLKSGNNIIIHGSIMFKNEKGLRYHPFFRYSQDYQFYLANFSKNDMYVINTPLYYINKHTNSITSKKVIEQRFYHTCALYYDSLKDYMNRSIRNIGEVYKFVDFIKTKDVYAYNDFYHRIAWHYLMNDYNEENFNEAISRCGLTPKKFIMIILKHFDKSILDKVKIVRKRIVFK